MFRDSFKYYKMKVKEPDLQQVINFDVVDTSKNLYEVFLNENENTYKPLKLPLGLIPVREWRCFKLQNHPGLIVVRNPFTTQGQRYWSARCLRDFPRSPNVINLSSILFPPAILQDWWKELQECSDMEQKRRIKIAMRWTTLGYHHNWNTKVYSEINRGNFPLDLNNLCKFFGEVLGFNKFTSQAAIVNYYPIGTTLAGHTDRSEANLEAPLFSFSFGQTAIFLIGDTTLEVKPTALFLKSGDLLVMSKESRLCYHAVPRILTSDDKIWNNLIAVTNKLPQNCESEFTNLHMEMELYNNVADEIFWTPFKEYLNDSRININVRQVLKEGQLNL